MKKKRIILEEVAGFELRIYLPVHYFESNHPPSSFPKSSLSGSNRTSETMSTRLGRQLRLFQAVEILAEVRRLTCKYLSTR
jgi:hypothetical protein